MARRQRRTHRYFKLCGHRYAWVRTPNFEAGVPDQQIPDRFVHYMLLAEVGEYCAYIDWREFSDYANRVGYMWWIEHGDWEGPRQWSRDPWDKAVNPLAKGETWYQRDAMLAAEGALLRLLHPHNGAI